MLFDYLNIVYIFLKVKRNFCIAIMVTFTKLYKTVIKVYVGSKKKEFLKIFFHWLQKPKKFYLTIHS